MADELTSDQLRDLVDMDKGMIDQRAEQASGTAGSRWLEKAMALADDYANASASSVTATTESAEDTSEEREALRRHLAAPRQQPEPAAFNPVLTAQEIELILKARAGMSIAMNLAFEDREERKAGWKIKFGKVQGRLLIEVAPTAIVEVPPEARDA